MNRDEMELWGGAALVILAGGLLFAPLFVAAQYTLILLAAGVLMLAAGALLIGLSQRGRAV